MTEIKMTDFERVCEFNRCFDFPMHDNLSDEKCRKLRLDLIEEELNELKAAFNQNDRIEEQDACADILYVAFGMAYTYKLNSDFIMNAAYDVGCEEIKNPISPISPTFPTYPITDLSYHTPRKETLFKSLRYKTDDRITLLNKLFNCFYQLKKYTNEQNISAVIVYLHRIIYCVYNFQYVSGYDSDVVFDIVHNSNMSKLCKNQEEAELTVLDYEMKYKEQLSPYDSPYYYKLDNGMYVVKNKSTGKALKSINYVKVSLV